MPAEVDTGGHWVLHCNSRADRPTATSIHVSIFARLPRIDEDRGLSEVRRRALKDRRQIEIHAREVQPTTNYHNQKSLSVLGSSTRIPRISDQEETIPSATDYASLQSSRRRRRGDGFLAYFASREFPRIIENVCLPITWKSQESEEKERVESRLRDVGTRQPDPAIANSIAGRRSHQDRSQTRPRPAVCDRKNLDIRYQCQTDCPGRTRITEENSLLSSHRSCTRSKQRSFGEDDEGFLGELFNDTRPDENARSNRDSGGLDERSAKQERERIERLDQDRKRIRNRRAYRVRSFLQLAFLLFLVAFGRCGPGLSGVIKFSARPTASVLGIGAIISAVSARSIDLTGDAGTRAERSANLSHITGSSRKIQMYVRNRHLQILPDGSVNGSNDDSSDYSEYSLINY